MNDGATRIDEMMEKASAREQSGDLESALSGYRQVLDIDVGYRPAWRSLFELNRDLGRFGPALECADRLVSLGDENAPVDRVELLFEMGEVKAASDALALLASEIETGNTISPAAVRVRGLMAREKRRARGMERAPEEAVSDEPRAVPNDADLVLMAELFEGREGVHARQWKASDGRCGYSPVHQQLTPTIIRQHLLGAVTVGTYVVRGNNRCGFLAFDIDTDPSAREADRDPLAPAWEAALLLNEELRRLGFSALIEESGAKGYHIWLFFETPWAAWKARRLGAGIVSRIALPKGATVEVFPAQARVQQSGLGNLIKLPLGLHLKTSRYSRIVDVERRPFDDPLGELHNQPRIGEADLEAVLETLPAGEVVSLAVPADYPQEKIDDRNDLDNIVGPTLSPEDDYRPEADEALAFLLARCPVLKRICDAVKEERLLTKDEKAILTYTVGHLTNGPKAVNHLLGLTGQNQMPLRSRLRGHPTGCSRIRSRLGISFGERGCDCEFDETLGYPNPLLHLSFLAALRDLEESANTVEDTAVEELENELSRIQNTMSRLESAAKHLEARLAMSAGHAGDTDVPGPIKAIPSVLPEQTLKKGS